MENLCSSLLEKMSFLLIIFFFGWAVSNDYNHTYLEIVYFLPALFYAWLCYYKYCKKRVNQHIIKPLNKTFAYQLYPDKHKKTGLNIELSTELYTELKNGLKLSTGLSTGLNTGFYTGLNTGLNTKLNTGLYNNFCKKINVLLFFVHNMFKKSVSAVKKCIAKIFFVALFFVHNMFKKFVFIVKKCIAKIFFASFMITIMEVTVIILLLSNMPLIIKHDYMCTGENYIF